MSIAGLKITLKAYFGFNFFYAGIIAFLIFTGMFLALRKRSKRLKKNISFEEITWRLVLAVYIALLIGGTLMNRRVTDIYQFNLAPFWSYKQLLEEKNLALGLQMIHNILVFIPWCIFFEKISPKMNRFTWGVGSALLFSVLVETTQLIFKCGLFEFDDIFHNTLGALLGYVFLRVHRLKLSLTLRGDSETTIQ